MSDRPSEKAIRDGLARLNAPPPEPDPPAEEAEVRHLRPVEEDKPPIVLVDTSTGEQVGRLADVEAEHEAEYNALVHKYRGALAKITKLERDEELEARKHELWAEAETLHMWWRLATGRFGRKFGADEFYSALPRLKERGTGPIAVLKAIAGAAYDPGTKRMKNGRLEKYDSWSLIMRSQEKFDSFTNRAPGDGDTHWRIWLVRRIESQFK